MNMTFFLGKEGNYFSNPLKSLLNLTLSTKSGIMLGSIAEYSMFEGMLDVTRTYSVVNFRWYVPCSLKLQRWSSIFRLLSVERWLVLIISIVIAVIATTLVARYSCTSEWQVYKTLTNSLTNVWAVFLGVSVSTMPRSPSLRSLFLAWVCFCLAFSTVIQAFLTAFLVDSGYETPIQNMDELFASGNKFAYAPELSNIFLKSDETEASNVEKILENCPSFLLCLNWTINQKNVSVLLSDQMVEIGISEGNFVGENSEPLLCSLKDGVVFQTGQVMLMVHGDPLLRRVNEIIGRVVEAGLFTFWKSLRINRLKLHSQKMGIFQPLDEYYSFNLYHMKPAFYLLLIGWCLSFLCFMVEMLYNRVLRKIMRRE
jgi:hypothetical protein